MTKPSKDQVTVPPYAVLVIPNPAGGFNAFAPSFPDIVSLSREDPFDALYAMYEVIASVVEDYRKDGRPLPSSAQDQPRAVAVPRATASLLATCALMDKNSEQELLAKLLTAHEHQIMSRFKPNKVQRKVVKLPERKPASRKTAKHAAKRTNGRRIAAG